MVLKSKKKLGMFYMVKKAFICTPTNKERVFTNIIMTKLTSNGKNFFFLKSQVKFL
jgi:hypothetical protein